MDTLDWTAVVAIASAVSAFAAAVSLVFVACATRAQSRATRVQSKLAEFNNCIEIVKILSEAQRKVRDSRNSAEYVFEFRELLNTLETLALLVNRDQATAAAREYTVEFLTQALAWIEVDPSMRELIEKSVTGPDTFNELMKIRKAYHEKITILSEKYKQNSADVSTH